MVEEKVDVILSQAHLSHVAFLVVGDPFGYVCYFSHSFNILIALFQFLIFVFFTGLLLTLILLFEQRKWELKLK